MPGEGTSAEGKPIEQPHRQSFEHRVAREDIREKLDESFCRSTSSAAPSHRNAAGATVRRQPGPVGEARRNLALLGFVVSLPFCQVARPGDFSGRTKVASRQQSVFGATLLSRSEHLFAIDIEQTGAQAKCSARCLQMDRTSAQDSPDVRCPAGRPHWGRRAIRVLLAHGAGAL